MIVDFTRGIVTPESVWRAIILYGANSATYKFAFGQTLLELAAQTQSSTLTLEQLAPRYSELLCQALLREPRQATAGRSKFLDACRSYNDGEISQQELWEATRKLGFVNVVEAFPRLGGTHAPIIFYEDRRQDRAVQGVVLTDEMFALAMALRTDLDAETAARWRLVETAWSTGVTSGLISPVVGVDANLGILTIGSDARRRAVTGVVPAFNGYQDGRCAYCGEAFEQCGLGPVVEHVLPFVLKKRGWNGPDVDAVWNLVLACEPCNSSKSGRAPHELWMPWLVQRNNDLIRSHHPLRETLMLQTGSAPGERERFVIDAYRAATEALPSVWIPPQVLSTLTTTRHGRYQGRA